MPNMTTRLRRSALAFCLGIFVLLTNGRLAFAAPNQWTRLGLTNNYVFALAIDPSNSAVLYASAFDNPTLSNHVYKSTDSGSTWFEADAGIAPYESVAYLAVSPITPSTVLAASEFGVTLSTDGGAHWNYIDANLTCPPFQGFALDSTNPGHVYIGTSFIPIGRVAGSPCSGLFRLALGSTVWEELPLHDPYLAAILVDQNDPAIVYAAGTDISQSIDGGKTWHVFNNSSTGPLHGVFSLCESPWDSIGLYAVTFDGIWRTDKDAPNWVRWTRGFGGLQITVLLADPVRERVFYAVGYDPTTYVNHVLRSSDGARTWSLFEQGLPAGLSDARLTMASAGTRILAATNAGAYAMELPCPPSRRCIRAVAPQPPLAPITGRQQPDRRQNP